MGLENTRSVSEAASFLKVSERTIRNYVQSGRLSAYKVGNTYHITNESLVALLEENFITKGDNEND